MLRSSEVDEATGRFVVAPLDEAWDCIFSLDSELCDVAEPKAVLLDSAEADELTWPLLEPGGCDLSVDTVPDDPFEARDVDDSRPESLVCRLDDACESGSVLVTITTGRVVGDCCSELLILELDNPCDGSVVFVLAAGEDPE